MNIMSIVCIIIMVFMISVIIVFYLYGCLFLCVLHLDRLARSSRLRRSGSRSFLARMGSIQQVDRFLSLSRFSKWTPSTGSYTSASLPPL